MVTAKDINSIIGISESFQLPEKLLAILLSEKKTQVFDSFMEIEQDLSFDWFTDYFQENHSNRSAMMQDFTPKELTRLLPELSEGYSKVLDICSGTGGLSIGAWNKNPDAFFVCEELSERALPLLLFNMAIRNIDGYIVNKDVLSGKVLGIYKLVRGLRYSDISVCEDEPDIKDYDLILTNPPYSLKYEWKSVPEYIQCYGEPPTKAADYAFILYGLSKLSSAGILLAILPHGVLFRGQKEGLIRENLIKQKKVKAVIGLPDKLFLNTQIPVCILAVSNNNEGVFFIDASREYLKEAKQNRLRENDITKIKNTFSGELTVDKYARIISISEMEHNDYNLSISRYIDTFEKEPLPDMDQLIDNLMDIKKNIRRTELELARAMGAMKELIASDDEDAKIINKYIRYLERGDNTSYEQLRFDL